MWLIWILYLVASNTCILYDMNNLQSVYTFPLKKKVNELFTHCTENSKIILIWKISRNFQDNIICNRKFIQNIFCLLEVVGVSFQTKLPTLFSIDYCKWICFMNVCHFQYKPICEMAKENFFWLNETNMWLGRGQYVTTHVTPLVFNVSLWFVSFRDSWCSHN